MIAGPAMIQEKSVRLAGCSKKWGGATKTRPAAGVERGGVGRSLTAVELAGMTTKLTTWPEIDREIDPAAPNTME